MSSLLASETRQNMRFSDQEITHSMWMLENQIEGVFELIALWLLFPNKRKIGPEVERFFPIWHEGLKDMIEKAANPDGY
jgi:hypothetical protein